MRALDVVEVRGHRGRGPVAVQELLQDRELRALTVVHRQPAHACDDRAGLCGRLGLGRESEEIRLERVRHDEAGRGGERAVDRGYGSPR